MEKENNHYKYIETLINLYTDLDCYSIGAYGECAVCILEKDDGYMVAIGERGHYHCIKMFKTPNEAVYAALENSGVEYQTTDYERIRDKFLESNIEYVEKLLKDENFLKTIPEIGKHFDSKSLEMMAIFSMVELNNKAIPIEELDNKMQFLIAALLVKRPKDKVMRK